MKRYLFFLFFLNMSYFAVAQYYVLGDDPAGIHWKQINTTNFQIIYPSSFEIKAQRMANILEKSYLFAGKTLQHQPAKISVILHTNTVRSNGFVAWAPSRVELFTTPFQDIYAQDWLEQLAIHELRHVVQIDKIDSELPGILRIILGEQAAALAIGLYLPFWFLEGDAVATETALSHSGRGRVPSFEMELKAQSIEKGIFSYNKAYLGSYKDYIPDYYQLGYQLVAGIRSKYGPESWSTILSRVAHKPLSLNAFSAGIKQVTGIYHESAKGYELLQSNWLIMLFWVVCLIITGMTIFMYKNRKRQVQFSIAGLILSLILSSFFFLNVWMVSKQVSGNYSFKVYMIFPVISAILIYLAIRAIGKDEMLVRSIDRIR